RALKSGALIEWSSRAVQRASTRSGRLSSALPNGLGCSIQLRNERQRIYEFFFTTVPMFVLLFFDSAVVEIDKVPGDQLVPVRSSNSPLLIVFSQPGLSNKNRSIFAFDGDLHVVDRILRES